MMADPFLNAQLSNVCRSHSIGIPATSRLICPHPIPLPPQNTRYLENKTPLEDLLEVKPDYPGGPPKERPALLMSHHHTLQRHGAVHIGGSASPSSMLAASTSSAGSAWASDMTDQPMVGGVGVGGVQHTGAVGAMQLGLMQHGEQGHRGRRQREGTEGGSPMAGCLHTPKVRNTWEGGRA